jgi:murein DD-endopeptidase MepM/ murein hydrolase activator NlpD
VDKDVFTLVVFPGATGSPKRIQVSKRWFRVSLYLVLVLAIGFAGSSAYLTQRYSQLVSEEAELTELRRESKIQKIRVEKFAQQVENFETEMSRLGRFERKLRAITALEDSPRSVAKNFGVGGPYGLSSHSLTTSLEYEARTLADKFSNNLAHLTTQAKVQAISFQELDNFFKNQKSLLISTPSIWPARGWVSSGFGFRKSPFTGLREKHKGLDIASRTGAAIRSTADGVVAVEGRQGGYGKIIEIDHGYGLVTRYGHNSKHLVKVGDRVKRGQIIALLGSTGRSTGPHLHYEVLLNGVPMNPKNYILDD